MKKRIRISLSSPADLPLVPKNEEEEIIRNVITILKTPEGDAPGYREFGMPTGYLHAPEATARTRFAHAALERISRFEPRAHVENVFFDEAAPGRFNAILEVTVDVTGN